MGTCRKARAVLAAAVLAAPAPALAAGRALSRPADAPARAALDLVYDGDFHGAEARLAAIALEHPDDPVLPYLQALALEWRLEQDPASRALDAEVTALADRALARADALLAREPGDARALLARGAAYGVKSRLHLFRWDKGPASREAVRMREALVAARDAGAEGLDLDFGLGLYDYYAAVLPRFFRLVAFVLRIPGGDRQRGLERVAAVARGGSLFHDDEARVQMYDIHAYFEHEPDRALHWIREMWRRHPGWPIWGLKLAQLLGEPMGLWAAERRRREGHRSCRGCGTPPELPVGGGGHGAGAPRGGAPRRPALRGGARDGRSRDPGRSGDAVGPRAGGAGARALRRPRAPGELSRGRSRCRCSRGRGDCASGATSPPPRPPVGRRLPSCRRATRGVSARPGRACAADGPRRRESSRARSSTDGATPWLRPSASLVLAQALESEGERARALELYRRAWEQPLGREALRKDAAEAIRRLDPAATLPDAPPFER